MYGESEMEALGLKGDEWGIGVQLQFVVDAAAARAARNKGKGELYIKHKAHGSGMIWNEQNQTRTWTLDVEEYFRINPRGSAATWSTSVDKHNNWYDRAADSRHFSWAATTDWCGLSFSIKGTITVGRLYEKKAGGLRPADGSFYFDQKNSGVTGARSPIGVPASSVEGVTEVQSTEIAKKGSWFFVPDEAFESASYEYWVEYDSCVLQGGGPTEDGPTTRPCDAVVTHNTKNARERRTFARRGAWEPE